MITPLESESQFSGQQAIGLITIVTDLLIKKWSQSLEDNVRMDLRGTVHGFS